MSRTITGTVASVKNAQTIVVSVTTLRQHSKYKKSFKVTRKFHADGDASTVTLGQSVTIREIAPLSALKRWSLV